MRIKLKVKEIMARNIISVDSTALIREAIALMVERDVGSVVVTKDGEPVGILTERDVLKRVCSENLCATGLTVGEVMSHPLTTIEAEATLGEAARLMQDKGIRRLLVTEGGKVVGIITQKDVMRGTLDVFVSLAAV